MPRGDAARIRAYAVGLVDDARTAGETGVTVRAGDVREALELNYRNAIIDIYQALGTRKLQGGEAGVELLARRGPSQGLNSVFEFRLVGGRALPRTPEAVSPVLEAPVNRPEGPRPSRRAPLSAVDRAVRWALRRVGALARTHRPNVASSPGHRGLSGLRWESVRRERDRLGRSRLRARRPLDLPPPEAPWPGRRGGCLCHRHRRATVAHCCHWSDCSAIGWRRSRLAFLLWFFPLARAVAGRVQRFCLLIPSGVCAPG